MVTLVNGLLAVGLIVLVSVGGLLVVRSRFRLLVSKANHDVADPLLSVVGTLFAVLLGFMVANAMQRFQLALETTQQEANCVMDLYRLASGIPEPTKAKLRTAVERYTDAVIESEWPKLAQKKTDERAWTYYGQIWEACVHFQPANDSENNLHQEMLERVAEFGDCRRKRVETMHNGLPPVLWIILLIGGAATIGFTYFFAVESMNLQVLMTAMVSIVISLNLFLLLSYDDPFSGDVMVQPHPFIIDKKSFKMIAVPTVPFEDQP